MQKNDNRSSKVNCLAILMGLGMTISAPSLANQQINMTTSISKGSKQLTITQTGTPLYEAQALWSPTIFSLSVTTGHQKQKGTIVINSSSVQAFNQQQRLLWEDKRIDKKVCLPELFGEFVRAHLEQLKSGESINCVGPIIKAKKLAPFNIYLEQHNAKELLVKVGPGSIGMWFFMDEIKIRMNADASKILAYNGVSPAPKTVNGEMAYLDIASELKNPLAVANIENSVLW